MLYSFRIPRSLVVLCLLLTTVQHTTCFGNTKPPCRGKANGGWFGVAGPLGCFAAAGFARLLFSYSCLCLCCGLQLLLEAFYGTGRVYQVLLAGVEWVAIGADFSLQLFLGGASLPCSAARRTVDGRSVVVGGVNCGFHSQLGALEAVFHALIKMPI